MSNKKKGISAIVATVLIILITVAAVTIVWAAIIPMVSDQLSKGTACLDAVSQISLVDTGYTCKNVDSVSLRVKRGAKAIDLAGIQVLLSAGGSTTSYTVSDDLPGANEERVFVVSTGATADINKIQIAPIITIGNKDEVCDVSDSRILSNC